MPAVDQRRAFYAKVWEQERKDLPLIYLWIGKNIVGMKQSITRVSAGAGRPDPAAGDADGAVVSQWRDDITLSLQGKGSR